MKIKRIEQVAIVVRDLEAAKEFFIDLGLEIEGETEVSGDVVDKIVALKDVHSKIVMMSTPEGDAKVELIQYKKPLAERIDPPPLSNTPGIRHMLFSVEDIEGIVAKLKKKGTELVGEIQNYENMYKLCYLRGPEGILLELAEKIG